MHDYYMKDTHIYTHTHLYEKDVIGYQELITIRLFLHLDPCPEYMDLFLAHLVFLYGAHV